MHIYSLCDGCNNNNINTQTQCSTAKTGFCEHTFLATVKSCKSLNVVEMQKLYLVTSPFCSGDSVDEMHCVMCQTVLLCLNVRFATTCFGHYRWSSSGLVYRILNTIRKRTVQLTQHKVYFAAPECFHGA